MEKGIGVRVEVLEGMMGGVREGYGMGVGIWVREWMDQRERWRIDS